MLDLMKGLSGRFRVVLERGRYELGCSCWFKYLFQLSFPFVKALLWVRLYTLIYVESVVVKGIDIRNCLESSGCCASDGLRMLEPLATW